MLRPTLWRMLLEFHLKDFAFMSAEHDVRAKSFSRKVRYETTYGILQIEPVGRRRFHLLYLTLLHVHSSRWHTGSQQHSSFPSPFSFYNILIFILPSFWIIPLFQCIHVDVNTYVRVLMCTCVHEYTLKSHTIMRVAFYQHNEEILIMLRPTP